MGHRSSNFKCDLMGNSLSTLHAFGKFPEINRNYLPAVVFTMFKVFPLLFQYKIYYNFTIDLKMMNWIEMVDLDLNNKEAMCLRLGFG
jgi:hypothetical protein